MSDRQIKILALLAVLVAVVAAWWLLHDRGSEDAEEVDASSEGADTVAGGKIEGDPELRPSPDGATRISGRVRAAGENGEGLAGARVCAWLLDAQLRALDPLAPTCVDAEDEGRYRLELPEPGRWRLAASAAKHQPAVWVDARDDREWIDMALGEQREDVDVVLASGGVRLAGTVSDAAGGPVEGAWVTALAAWGRQPVATALSGEGGRFELWVAAGEYGLRSVAEGYAPGYTGARGPNDAVEITLVPESVLVGRVVNEQGEGLAGVEVRPDRGRRLAKVTVSEADGSFRLDGLHPGIYKPEAIGEGVYGQAERAVHLSLGETSEPVELRVYPAHRVRGQIVAVDQLLPEGAEQRERGCARGELRLSGAGFTRRAHADEEGWVVVDGLPPGHYQLKVRCPDQREPFEGWLELAGDVDDARWEIAVGGLKIRGRVVDARGQGVEGVHVDATNKDGELAHNLSFDEGKFVLAVDAPGRYELRAWTRGQSSSETQTVEVGDGDLEGVELDIGAVAAVAGVVVDQNGEGLANQRVALLDQRARPLHWQRSDGEGRFRFEGLAPGKRWVAHSNQIDPAMPEPVGEAVELRGGETREVELVRERGEGRIRGTVIRFGKPVADAWVVAGRGTPDSLIHDWERGPVLVDSDGSFELDGLGEGEWSLRAYRKAGGEAKAEGVDLGDRVELEIFATGRVAGRVHFPDDRAPAHFVATLRAGSGSSAQTRELQFYRSEGAFEFVEVPSASWTLTVVAEGGSARREFNLLPGEEISKLDLELDPRVTIRGRFVDARSGEPVSIVNVATHGLDSGYAPRVASNEDGRFELPGVPVGHVQLEITPRDWNQRRYSMQFPWVRTAATPLVQDIGTLELAASRLKPREAAGDLGFGVHFVGPVQDPERLDEVRAEVDHLRTGGPAERAGLELGQVIESIDGESVRGAKAWDARLYLKVPVGTTVTLGLEGGEELRVEAGPPP